MSRTVETSSPAKPARGPSALEAIRPFRLRIALT
jgi:hypothetical protein